MGELTNETTLKEENLLETRLLNRYVSTQSLFSAQTLCVRNTSLRKPHFVQILVTIVDVRFGRKDGEDHLFLRIGNDWQGDRKSGLIIGHVSVDIMYTSLFLLGLTHLINS